MKPLKFSLAALLVVVTAICGYFAGYDRGLQVGVETIENQKPYEAWYNVDEIVSRNVESPLGPAEEDAEPLIAKIKSKIQPNKWMLRTDYEIEFYQRNRSLLVIATKSVHDDIEQFLQCEIKHLPKTDPYSSAGQ